MTEEKKGIQLKTYEHDPFEFGIPAQAFLVERLCESCTKGLLRGTGRAAQTPDGQLFMHECSNCKKIVPLPVPYPRPDFAPFIDATQALPAMEQYALEHKKDDKPKIHLVKS